MLLLPVDTVDHTILLSKLQAHGIQGSTNQWFCSYLKDRTQKRVVNCDKLSKMFLRCSVPQGTILRPLLFLPLYINDLPFFSPAFPAKDVLILIWRKFVCGSVTKLTLNMTKVESLLISCRQRLSSTADPFPFRAIPFGLFLSTTELLLSN